VVRAPWLTHGYLKDAHNSVALWAGGWLHTGDIAAIEPDGYVRITDRIKDVIKTGGEWVSSLDVEDLILRHEAVAEAAVLGVPDAKWGERPMAVLVLQPDAEVSAEQIREHLRGFVARGLLSAYAVPDQVRFEQALPKTSVGKLNKRALRESMVG
jgi:fatty-acyl-CoA synthase